MQAGTTSPRPRVSDIASWAAVLLGVGLLLLLLLSFVLERPKAAPTGTPVSPSSGRVAYFEFGVTADTLWLVNAADPTQRQKAFSVQHAREFGVMPSVSPDGRRVAYAALAADNPVPTPDTPAGLWLADVALDAEPKLLATNADLRVPPVWSADGASVIFRRSDAQGYALVSLPVTGSAESVLVSSAADAALFPVAYAPDGRFYYVTVGVQGSLLGAADPSGASSEVAQLSQGLSREWRLSPDGTHLAFLELTLTPAAASSQAFILDLATGTRQAITGAGVSAFGPTWNTRGELVVGTLSTEGESAIVTAGAGTTSHVPGPERGFDVPLAFTADGGSYLVRAFSGESAAAPGTATLTFIGPNGERQVIARGDVTFAGWSVP